MRLPCKHCGCKPRLVRKSWYMGDILFLRCGNTKCRKRPSTNDIFDDAHDVVEYIEKEWNEMNSNISPTLHSKGE